MKTLLFLLAVWGVLGLVQCNKEDMPVQSQNQSQDVKLQVNESAQLTIAGSKVTLTLKELQDARCPTNVDCAWQGQANVVAELRDDADARQIAALCLGACRNDSVAVQVGSRSYALKLQTVTPYPTWPEPASVRREAHLRLAQQ